MPDTLPITKVLAFLKAADDASALQALAGIGASTSETVASAVAGEASARASADASLSQSVAAEATARAAADTALSTNIAAEATTRAAADTALSIRVAALEGDTITAGEITDSTAVGRAVLTSATQADALTAIGAASAAALAAATLSSLNPALYQGQITSLSQAIPAPGTAGRWYASTVAGTLTDPDAASAVVQISGYLIDTGTAWLARNATASNEALLFAEKLVTQAMPIHRNLFSYSRLTADSAIRRSNGTVAALTGYYATDFMQVTPGGFVTTNKTFLNNATYGTAFYDRDQVFISSTNLFVANTPLAIPSNAYWMRTTIAIGVSPAGWIITEGSTVAPVGKTSMLLDEQTAHSRDLLWTRENARDGNLFDPLGIVSGFTVSTNGGVLSSPSFAISNYMPVIPGENIILNQSTGAGSGYGIAWYDINKLSLTGTAGTLAANTPYLVPELAAYARISVNLSSVLTMAVYVGSSLPAYFMPFSMKQEKRWRGMGFGSVGDSISDDGTWQGYVTRHTQAIPVAKYATSGASMGYKQYAITAGSLAGIDVLIVFLGTNDWGFNRTLGAPGDAPSGPSPYGQYVLPGSFCGDTRRMIELILTEKPGIRLGFMTMLPRNGYAPAGGSGVGDTAVNGNGNTLRQFADALKGVCEKYSIPVLDLNRESGWNEYNLSMMTVDGLHPSATGSAFYAPRVARWVESL